MSKGQDSIPNKGLILLIDRLLSEPYAKYFNFKETSLDIIEKNLDETEEQFGLNAVDPDILSLHESFLRSKDIFCSLLMELECLKMNNLSEKTLAELRSSQHLFPVAKTKHNQPASLRSPDPKRLIDEDISELFQSDGYQLEEHTRPEIILPSQENFPPHETPPSFLSPTKERLTSEDMSEMDEDTNITSSYVDTISEQIGLPSESSNMDRQPPSPPSNFSTPPRNNTQTLKPNRASNTLLCQRSREYLQLFETLSKNKSFAALIPSLHGTKILAQYLCFAIECECHEKLQPAIPSIWKHKDSAITQLFIGNQQTSDLQASLIDYLISISGHAQHLLPNGTLPIPAITNALLFIRYFENHDDFRPSLIESAVLLFFFGQELTLSKIKLKNHMLLEDASINELQELFFRLCRCQRNRIASLSPFELSFNLNELKEDAMAIIHIFSKLQILEGNKLHKVA